MRLARLLILLSTITVCACSQGDPVVGRATVIDGDGLRVGDRTIRLFGIDAPEGRQTCRRNGAEWACGDAASRKLREVVGGRIVTCERKDMDSYGRIVAVCRAGGVDVSDAMVRSGMALAYRRFSDDYVPAEQAARRAVVGLWASEFTPPWQWRQGMPPSNARGTGTARRPGCDIKGNVNRNGQRIYHVPGSASYEDTVIDTARGEHWFCSEREAQQAGWRPPRR
jgi:endonuclease YncB( thermonuclease family)